MAAEVYVATTHAASAPCCALTPLIRPWVATLVETLFDCGHGRLAWASWVGCCSVREEGLIDLEKRLFVIHEEIENVRFISACEVRNLDSVLGELSKSE